jgi:hypothetical protein
MRCRGQLLGFICRSEGTCDKDASSVGCVNKVRLLDAVLSVCIKINIHGLTWSNRPKISLRVLIKSR